MTPFDQENMATNEEEQETHEKVNVVNNNENEEQTTSDDSQIDVSDQEMDDQDVLTEDEFSPEEGHKKIAELSAENASLQTRILRAQADYENFRRRTNEEKATTRKFRAQSLIEDILPVLDNFNRALDVTIENDETKALKQGVDMVFRQLNDALKKEGLEETTSVGDAFDPNLHQAVMKVDSEEHEADSVIEVLQSGYQLNGRVIRPAMVKVNS